MTAHGASLEAPFCFPMSIGSSLPKRLLQLDADRRQVAVNSADVLPEQATVGPDEIARRHADDLVLLLNRSGLVVYHGEGERLALHESPHERLAAGVDAHRDDTQPTRRVVVVNGAEILHLFSAGGAPGRPHVDQRQRTAATAELHRAPRERSRPVLGQSTTDLDPGVSRRSACRLAFAGAS